MRLAGASVLKKFEFFDQVGGNSLFNATRYLSLLFQFWIYASMKELRLERVEGIEPSYAVWKTAVLPLNYTRLRRQPVSLLCEPAAS